MDRGEPGQSFQREEESEGVAESPGQGYGLDQGVPRDRIVRLLQSNPAENGEALACPIGITGLAKDRQRLLGANTSAGEIALMMRQHTQQSENTCRGPAVSQVATQCQTLVQVGPGRDEITL